MVKKGLEGILSQAKKMQEQMAEIQENLADQKVEASSGGGMVNVVANGKNQVLSIKIDPSVIEDGDVEMIEDLVLAGVNEALRKSQEIMKSELSKMTGGMKIPGLI